MEAEKGGLGEGRFFQKKTAYTNGACGRTRRRGDDARPRAAGSPPRTEAGARTVRRGPSFAGAQFGRVGRRELWTEAEAAVTRRVRRYGPEGTRPRWAMPERRAFPAAPGRRPIVRLTCRGIA